MKHLKYDANAEWLAPNTKACVTHFESAKDGIVLVVSVRPSDDYPDILGTLVHESVHIWQQYKKYIGETKPGKEQEAYAIEAIWRTLVDDYARQCPPMEKPAETVVPAIPRKTDAAGTPSSGAIHDDRQSTLA